ncbi:MAG: hypothetical protein JSS66_05695 [Armatimonadetes bacterium]|nr:hypothetical protein [Armatimonadota bacterium]
MRVLTLQDWVKPPETLEEAKEKAEAVMARLTDDDNDSLAANIRQAFHRGRWGDTVGYWNEYVMMHARIAMAAAKAQRQPCT